MVSSPDVRIAKLFVLLTAVVLVQTAVTTDLFSGYVRDDDDSRIRARKARIVDKLKNKFNKFKKHEASVKLVGGGDIGNYQGNVEIFHNGKWGSICDDEWDSMEATVVCRQLGFEGVANATGNSWFGRAKRPFWMNDVYCDGTENRLADCRFDGWGTSNCNNAEAAGVICTAKKNTTEALSVARKYFRDARIKKKMKRRSVVTIRLVGGRMPDEGRVEIKIGNEDWGVACGDGWSLFEAAVVCRQLGLGYAFEAIQNTINYFYDGPIPKMVISGIRCHGDESNVAECHYDQVLNCPGSTENVASVVCRRNMADLVLDHIELMRTSHLEDRQLFWLQCAMEENCLASRAYEIQKQSENNWLFETRRLLRFTARILNAGTADFRPDVPKHLWEWHMCHMHYHSIEVFATFDISDSNGNKLAEGHKASFCLEDSQCMSGVTPRYRCANYGDQGISVNCSDVYKHNIDCQWVDISELLPGEYTLKVAVNPQFKIGEMSFDNNAAICQLLYTETFATVHNCTLGRP